jgi:N-acetyl-gamma-glutamyl-phosphate reductase
MKFQPLNVALVGASGYTGIELTRILLTHPGVSLKMMCAFRSAGQPVDRSNPSLIGLNMPPLLGFDADQIAAQCEYAFLGLPHKTAQDVAHELLLRGVKVIDLSADHRFDDPDFYGSIYESHRHPENCLRTVYGCPELNREKIRTSDLVGAPGCYPTSVILGTMPALAADLLSETHAIADCKSGVTGAGRTPGVGTHYPETADGMHAYKTLNHRHAPEMERILGNGMSVEFVPHLVPMNRGILSTVYLRLKAGVSLTQVRTAYEDRYRKEPFISLLPDGQHPDPRHVRGTNRCHIGVFVKGTRLVVQSAIDNLGKGAAGQAIQCFNLMADFPETLGLEATAVFP